MKKRIAALLMLAILCMMTAGCVRMDATITVNKNGSVNLSMLVAASDQLAALGGDSDAFTMSDEDKAELKEEGFTCTDYSEDGYTGYMLTGENIDSAELGDALDDENVITVDGKNYTLDWALMDEVGSDSVSYLSMLKAYDGYMQITLNLPDNAKMISNNATTVSEDGRTLTWDLTAMDTSEHISAEFQLQNSLLIPIIIAAGVMLVIVVILLVVLLSMKKKRSGDETIPENTEG